MTRINSLVHLDLIDAIKAHLLASRARSIQQSGRWRRRIRISEIRAALLFNGGPLYGGGLDIKRELVRLFPSYRNKHKNTKLFTVSWRQIENLERDYSGNIRTTSHIRPEDYGLGGNHDGRAAQEAD